MACRAGRILVRGAWVSRFVAISLIAAVAMAGLAPVHGAAALGIPQEIAVTKNVNATTINAGDQIVYTINVLAIGPNVVGNIQLTDTLPQQLWNLSWTISDSQGNCSNLGQQITCSLGSLNQGNAAVVEISAFTPQQGCGSFINFVNVTYTVGDAGLPAPPANGFSPEVTIINCPTPTVTNTPVPTDTPTLTATPTDTATATPTESPTNVSTDTPTSTATLAGGGEETPIGTATATATSEDTGGEEETPDPTSTIAELPNTGGVPGGGSNGSELWLIVALLFAMALGIGGFRARPQR